MIEQYLPVFVLLVLAVAFAALSLVVSRLLGPRSPNDRKQAPYECGIIPTRDTPERFPVRFYLVAMIFIVFDIEIIFFYPWAIAHRNVGVFGLVAVLIFALAVFESFIYLIGNGALEWGSSNRNKFLLENRLSFSTEKRVGVRVVGLEGRPINSEDTNENRKLFG
tara:strand:- start:655 stop:1149 length:495 start_codon:yes stop_codon:yes gene_type:complete